MASLASAPRDGGAPGAAGSAAPLPSAPPEPADRQCLRWRTRRLVRRASIVIGLAAIVSSPCGAEGPPISEYEAKAAFLLNVSRFTQWPSDSEWPTAPIVIGVLESDSFGVMLDGFLLDKVVKGRKVIARHGPTLAELGRCQILFVGRSEALRVEEVIAELDSESVLTIGETDDFIAAGGMIQIGLIENRVRFAIDHRRVARVGIVISSKVLSLSRITIAR